MTAMRTTAGRETTGKRIGFWVVTAVVVVGFFVGAAFDIARVAYVRAIISHLGYPAYFPVILGIWKLLGAVVVIAPGLPRLKEWAYAGMFFDLSGAVASHLISGDGAGAIATPAMLLVLVVVSWALRPADRILGALPGSARVAREHPATV
jgi:DoxX-like family